MPEIETEKTNQLLQIWNEKAGELEQIFRIKGTSVQPALFNDGIFKIILGEGESRKEHSGVKTKTGSNAEYMEAPAVFKRKGKYYFFASGCTGWAPNRCLSIYGLRDV